MFEALHKQTQVGISLLGLTGTANVSKVFYNIHGEIHFVVHDLRGEPASFFFLSIFYKPMEERVSLIDE